MPDDETYSTDGPKCPYCGRQYTAMGLLKGKQQEVFERVYAAYPASISRDRLCADMKLSPTASTMGVYISAVSRLGIIENAEPGHVRAAAWLFPKGMR